MFTAYNAVNKELSRAKLTKLIKIVKKTVYLKHELHS